MADHADECSCVVDCSGLYEIASTKSDNLKSLYIDRLERGIIGVPTCVWQEFQEIYEEEAAALGPHITRKLRMKKEYYIGAASIADRINSRLSLSTYDRQTDLYTASICFVEQYLLLTTPDQVTGYKAMNCCKVQDLGTWANQQT